MKNFPIVTEKNDNIKYVGVTTKLGQYKDPFDAALIASKVNKMETSEYYKIDVDVIIKYWNLTAKFGNKEHNKIEQYLKENLKCEYTDFLIENGINFNNSYSEVRLHSDNLRLKGFVDIIEERYNVKKQRKEYHIHDIKTFKKVHESKIYEASMQILLYCVMLNEHLPENEIAIPGKIIHIGNISKPDNLDIHTWVPASPHLYNFDKRAINKVKTIINDIKDLI